MTPYHTQHADIFRAVSEILVREYNATEVTEDTVAGWCECCLPDGLSEWLMEPSNLANMLAYVEGYERRES